MNIIRRSLGGLFAMLGTYYCVVSVLTLVRLPSVTARWIQRSGDPDFKYDYGFFMQLIVVGAVLVGVFGFRTAIKGVAAVRGSRDSWLALAIGAPFLHWFWFLYRTIGNGVLDHAAQAGARRHNGLRFGTICMAYLAMWIVMRYRASATVSGDQMTPSTGDGGTDAVPISDSVRT